MEDIWRKPKNSHENGGDEKKERKAKMPYKKVYHKNQNEKKNILIRAFDPT
jgi:hypothetical protein